MMKCKTILFAMVILLNINFIESQSVVIKNATIYDGISDEPFVGNILFEDGIIKKVSSTLVQGDISIDATGKIVTPGFIAADTEIGIVEIGALSTTRDDGSDIYKIGFSIHDAFNPNSTLVPWNRANGITSAITLPRNTSSPIGGLGSYFVLDGSLNITSNRDMVMIGKLGASNSSSRSETLSVMDDILSFASSITVKDIKSNSDLNALIENSAVASYMELMPRDLKALYSLINENLPLIIKSNRASDILKLIELKKKYKLNLIIMGAQESALVSESLAKNNIPLIVNPINNIPNSFDELASNINLSSKLEKSGIKLMFNTSRAHNYHLIRQGAGIAVANGMTYGGAIRSITSNVAESFNIKGRGAIKQGNIADLVIWEADPLEPSSMPERVYINGVDVDLTTRSSRLRDRYTKNLEKPNTYRN